MPIITPSSRVLPSYTKLAAEGFAILTHERATTQDIRELHIGFLNMMPDAAFTATERQFLRLIASSNQIAQFIFHPFTINVEQRGPEIQQYVADYYDNFEQLKLEGLDALVITGANVANKNIQDEDFWEPLKEIVDWAYDNVTSIFCSCLASHALLKIKYDIDRQPLPEKCWGLFNHTVSDPTHPLVHGMNSRFDACHSRHNEVTSEAMRNAGLKVLVESEEAGAHLAVSEDGFRIIFLQGHPEYDTVSLLKEYKREVMRYISGDRGDYPPFPANYLSLQSQAILEEYRLRLVSAMQNNTEHPEFPELHVRPLVHNSWQDTANAFTNRWLGQVYQTTNIDRTKQFEDCLDPNDPLGLYSGK